MRNLLATQPLVELAHPGRRGCTFPESDVPERLLDSLIPRSQLAATACELPELAEPDVIRHFVNLSTLNMSVDTHFYPLGSCTMKYNPKRHERLSRLPGLVDLHPYQIDEAAQGMLAILYELQQMLAEISGLPAVSLHPAAGAQGELTALLVAAAYFHDKGERRTKVLFPASAHGTNPASAALAGFECVQLDVSAERARRYRGAQSEPRRVDGSIHDHEPQHARTLRAGDQRGSRDCCIKQEDWSTSTART